MTHLPYPTTLLYGGRCSVPSRVATCPECDAKLEAVSEEWNTDTGEPTTSLLVGCSQFDQTPHKHWQSDWQPVIDRVQKWAGCVEV